MTFFPNFFKKNILSSVSFNSSETINKFLILIPLFFGVFSVLLGADDNWDLKNYHLYNAYSFLNEKLKIDLAPAGMQTYFNPLIDLPYYWMTLHFPAPLIGFIMGVLHGMNFIILFAINRKTFLNLPLKENLQISFLLAIYGCLTLSFLSAVGNTMGDNLTSVLVLSSFYIVVTNHSMLIKSGQFFVYIFVAGIFAGLAAGLKLTNVIYATALCLGIFVISLSWKMRFLLAFIFGLGVMTGFAVTGGYWFYTLWINYHNPLFPQFGNFFPHELITNIGIADTRWGPRNFLETISWPLIMSFNPLRVSELRMYQVIWGIVYVASIYAAIHYAISTFFLKRKPQDIMAFPAKYLIAFILIGFVLWLKIFSIQRYLVALEICLPTLLFIFIHQVKYYSDAKKIVLKILFISTIIGFAGYQTWGHADWAKKMFRLDESVIKDPEDSVVVIVGGNPPYGWIASLLPTSLAVIQIDGSFPANIDRYKAKIQEIIHARQGPVYALFPAQEESTRSVHVKKLNARLSLFGITSHRLGCMGLKQLLRFTGVDNRIGLLDLHMDENKCRLTVIHESNTDADMTNEAYAVAADGKLSRYGFSVDLSTCATYEAYVGAKAYPFQLCRIHE